MSELADAYRTALSLVGTPATTGSPLGGSTYRLRLADGRTVVLKRGHAAGAIAAEVASLRWLAEPGAVPLPAVLGHDQQWLALAWIERGQASESAAEELGRGLAVLHNAGAPAFGAAPPSGTADAWIGAAPMRNASGPSWPEWYAEYRVLPYLRFAVDHEVLEPDEAAVVSGVCDQLPELAGPAEPPARLHGDLWRGNVCFGVDGRAWLIDPAGHGGHRETDLAMLALFGCPHLDRILAGYQEIAPLATGWAGRVALHQLFPLAVHTALFGRGYAGQLLAAARAALAAH